MDEKVRLFARQYLCTWGTTERLYCITLNIRKSVEPADFPLDSTAPIPGSGGRLKIRYTGVTSESLAPPRVDSFSLSLEIHTTKSCTIRIAILTPEHQYIHKWEESPTHHDYHSRKTWSKPAIISSDMVGIEVFLSQTWFGSWNRLFMMS